MYKWYIELIFNNGITQEGFFTCDWEKKEMVSQLLLQGGIYGFNYITDNNNSYIYFKINDLSSFKITEYNKIISKDVDSMDTFNKIINNKDEDIKSDNE
jgi:hypothetical protein